MCKLGFLYDLSIFLFVYYEVGCLHLEPIKILKNDHIKINLFMRIKTNSDCLASEMGESEEFLFFLSSQVKQLLLVI